MRKLVLSSLIAVLLSGCATAHQQTEQEKALVGDWICHVKPAAKSPLPVEHFDYVTYHADQTVLLRGISQIDTQEGWMRYLLQAKAKWQANDGKLSYDFTDRLFKIAHSPQVAKIIEQSPEFKELKSTGLVHMDTKYKTTQVQSGKLNPELQRFIDLEKENSFSEFLKRRDRLGQNYSQDTIV